MSSVRLRPRAEDDLADIWAFIARDDSGMADRFIDFLTEKFTDLANQPLIGKPCPELADGLRRHVIRDYLIFYTPEDDGIVIERVLHGARDVDALF